MTSKVAVLWEHYPSSVQRLNTHLSTIRLHHKAIRTREEALSELRSRKRSLAGRIDSVEKKLAKMGPENKELAKTTSSLKELRNEMSALSQEVLVETAGLEDFKRRSMKESLGMKCSALVELAEKMIVMAEMAGAMLEELDMEPMQPGGQRRPYQGTPRTEDLLQEGLRCLADVTFRPINSTAQSSFRGPAGGGQQQQGGGGYDAPPFLSHHPDRTLSASEMTVGDGNNGMPPFGAGGYDSSYDYANRAASQQVNGYAGNPQDWSPQQQQQQQQSQQYPSSYGQQQDLAHTSSTSNTLDRNNNNALSPSADAPADDWSRGVMGAISGAQHKSTNSDASAAAAGGADAGSNDAKETLTSPIGTSAGQTASGVGAADPIGRSSADKTANDSRDSLADLGKTYGRLQGAPVIANAADSGPGESETPAGSKPEEGSGAGAGFAGAGASFGAAGAAAAAASHSADQQQQQQGAYGTPTGEGGEEEALRAYFKSVGSTRAAQEAVRRPASAQGGGAAAAAPARYSAYLGAGPPPTTTANGNGVGDTSVSSNVSSAAGGNHTASSIPFASSGAGDDAGVKKVTAGAFRKGFGRNMSNSGIALPLAFGAGGGPSSRPTTPGVGARPVYGAAGSDGTPLSPPRSSAEHGGAGGVGDGTQGSVAPLHINKRQSQTDMLRTGTVLSQSSGGTDAAPPYSEPTGSASQNQLTGPQNAAKAAAAAAAVAAAAGSGGRQDNYNTHSVYGGIASSGEQSGYTDPNTHTPGQYGFPMNQQHSQPSSQQHPQQQPPQQYSQPAYGYGGGPPPVPGQAMPQYYYGAPPPGAGGYPYSNQYASPYDQRPANGYQNPYGQ